MGFVFATFHLGCSLRSKFKLLRVSSLVGTTRLTGGRRATKVEVLVVVCHTSSGLGLGLTSVRLP